MLDKVFERFKENYRLGCACNARDKYITRCKYVLCLKFDNNYGVLAKLYEDPNEGLFYTLECIIFDERNDYHFIPDKAFNEAYLRREYSSEEDLIMPIVSIQLREDY